MTTKQPIGLEDIAGISSVEEGRAVALALFNQVAEIKRLRVRVLEFEYQRDFAVLQMWRDETDDHGEPLDPDGQIALRWAAHCERLSLKLEQARKEAE